MIPTLRRIDNLLMAAIGGAKTVVLKVETGSNATERYECKTITLTIGEYQAKTTLTIQSGPLKNKVEHFICVDIAAIRKLNSGDAMVCSIVVDLIGKNEATLLTMRRESNPAHPIVFYRPIDHATNPSPPISSITIANQTRWDLRSEILNRMQTASPMYSKMCMYNFLRVWFDSDNWKAKDKVNVIRYLHTKVPDNPGILDSAHDMLVKYCLDNELKTLVQQRE